MAFRPRSDKTARFSEVTYTGLSTDADNLELDEPPRQHTKGSLFPYGVATVFVGLEIKFVR